MGIKIDKFYEFSANVLTFMNVIIQVNCLSCIVIKGIFPFLFATLIMLRGGEAIFIDCICSICFIFHKNGNIQKSSLTVKELFLKIKYQVRLYTG